MYEDSNKFLPKFMAARVQRAELVTRLRNGIEADSTVRHFTHTVGSYSNVLLFITAMLVWKPEKRRTKKMAGDKKGQRKSKKKKCRDPGLNRGPLDLQSNALPTELSRLNIFEMRSTTLPRLHRRNKRTSFSFLVRFALQN
jgi:hypothetical protein